jgi:hypothetical protein
MRYVGPCVLLCTLCCVWASGMRAQDDVHEPPTTLSVYQALAAEAFGEACGSLSVPESVMVTLDVQPVGAYWYIESVLAQEMRAHRMHLVPSGGAWQFTCAVKDARVRYSDVRRDGLLGTRVVDRTVSLELWLRMTDREHAQFLIDRESRVQKTDTIDVGDVSRVEHPDVPATRSIVPAEGFFSSWLEPLVLVGAIGVAVFLLFTTRS